MTLEDLQRGGARHRRRRRRSSGDFKNKLYSAGGEIDRETRIRYRDIRGV